MLVLNADQTLTDFAISSCYFFGPLAIVPRGGDKPCPGYCFMCSCGGGPTPRGGGVRGLKKVSVPITGLKFPGVLTNFVFPLEVF